MKKTYINPTLEVVRVKSQQLLAGSVDAPIDGSQDNPSALSREMFLDGEY